MNLKPQGPRSGTVDYTDTDWWRGAVIYQIYPRSYQDSNNDGIGDLKGIVMRLPYIASLGVDAIWISPFFMSPMRDFGYDVSDYCNVDPIFGTLADYDVLIATAHELGVRVIIDQVLSHTSDQHRWFGESRASKDNAKSSWYVWADAKPDGGPPNNWISIFGGSAWQWDGQRRQYYLHNFLSSQPDLNFHNPEVQNALLEVSRFWLDRGTDGFRLDTINFFFADSKLRDNPAIPAEQRNDSIAPEVNPYNYQEHIYSKNRPENLGFLKKYRALLDEYPARTCVGEVGDALRGMEIIGEYTSGDDRIHMCYAFDFLSNAMLTAERLGNILARFETAAADGWACWAFSNHDIVRHVSRWKLGPQAQRCYTTLMMCLRGTPCLYQGEELALAEAEIEYQDLQDPYGIEFWPEFKGRDGCRTPMVWERSNQFGGFSTAETWLPIPAAHLVSSVETQEEDAGSILHHYRNAIAFRKQHVALTKGEQVDFTASSDIASFLRITEAEVIFCAFNLGTTVGVVALPDPDDAWSLSGSELGCQQSVQDGAVSLQPWQSVIAVKMV